MKQKDVAKYYDDGYKKKGFIITMDDIIKGVDFNDVTAKDMKDQQLYLSAHFVILDDGVNRRAKYLKWVYPITGMQIPEALSSD